MHIKILGYNIFQKGGTTRSNLNLIQSFLRAGHQVTYVNYMHFRQRQVSQLKAEEGQAIEGAQFIAFRGAQTLAQADLLILTREDFFEFAREVKHRTSEMRILGEIHSPLAYLNPQMDLALEAIDAVRVSTPKIAEAFQERYDYPYVFPMYVNHQHVQFQTQPVHQTHNLLMKARFEDEIKDISYVLKLMRYFVYTQGETRIHLYLQGYGPSLELYENLVVAYHIEDYVHINGSEPTDYIYVSTSPYETFGYSILEAMAQGNRVCLYPGEDGVLKDIYAPFHAVTWITKSLESDAAKIVEMVNGKYTDTEREADVETFHTQLAQGHDTEALIAQTMAMAAAHTIDVSQIAKPKMKASYQYVQNTAKRVVVKVKETAEQAPKSPFRKGSRLYQFTRKGLFNVEAQVKKFQNQRRHVSGQAVFIESFHGKNFSGDPKAIACAMKRLYPELTIYVSAADPLVEMEVRSYDMTPIRFGTRAYMRAFERCRYAVINGNLWDRLVKHPDQQVIQTWHGFPLKRMVNDLVDAVERQKQAQQFAPRMQKWNVLLSTSERYETYIRSAFRLDTHPNLTILRHGAPRNSLLIRHQNDEAKWLEIQEKYFFQRDATKKYILFCPTWRKNARQSVSELDIVALLERLPSSYEMIVKLHPNEGHLRELYQNLHPRVHCFFNEMVDIQELYLISDVLISDYSSAMFDYAHLNRPILILDEDTVDYQQDVGFYFDMTEFPSIQKVTPDVEKIQQYIETTSSVDHQKVIAQLMTYDQSDSDEQVVRSIFAR
ncbi:CDP-glycerol glycerophosphotransferase family protein [Staphylococcus pseudintermedius]|uniref:CDP-glycerol glycerophosphotransferase family protein n=1 Tax=Staphylococcus pseudintermedius TaxID=283734 RepID=UPI0034ACBFD0|nr:CDP-glycerol glycerophosphotransferase family protein [Staphylococcus pseudintermedius]EJY3792070.1 CDP-glycerol glycerophosphotransferase family protein [Staphylococcus pseudintermedius]MCE5441905.1 CDP-glycerol glycerophosphotransferase family protein [Staphylococcus pseudintermedius]MCE5490269.1 CDP-glycerol glycerophosphotransferase family protein [Staphylococcus pseudintermedius]MCE5569435.1 CDP-glycerol glycerophosphotransferase family protein [Staphylococcus pseudintermedius]